MNELQVCMESEDIALVRLNLRHQQAFITAVMKSRSLHQNYVHPPQTEEQFQQLLIKSDFERNYSLLIWHQLDNLPVGVINFSEVIRGLFQNAFVGVYAFEPYAGKGYMQKAIKLAAIFAKQSLSLHRLEANIQPDNHKSIRLFKNLNFVKEGYSKNYLKIGGQWRDHERWALLLDDI